jgi:hypothetical protein
MNQPATIPRTQFWAAGAYRAPQEVITPRQLLQAAYLAEGAIERIHDLTSLDTATMALLHFERLLIRADHGTQEDADALSLRENAEPAPTLLRLTEAHLNAWKTLYLRIHAPHMAQAI